MSVVQTLATAFAPWQSLYSNSAVVSTTVTAIHTVGMLVGGGLAIGADRATLRALRGSDHARVYQLGELRDIHRPVVIALAILFVSGLMQAGADIETFAGAPVFWVKLALVGLLLANGALLYSTERRMHDSAEPVLARRLAWSARISLTLWILTAIAGTVLTNA